MEPSESMLEPFTAELTIEPGDVIDGSAANGFAESVVTLRATRRGAPGSGVADLRWGAEQLGTGISVATFLDDFWSGAPVAHCDALDFGRMLLSRLLMHPNVRDRWDAIRSWRGARPLRVELVLPPARRSPISAVPFELLADEESFLFYAGRAALVRCIRDLEPRQAMIRRGDRLLVAWANPTDVVPRVDDQIFEQHEASIASSGRAAALDVLAPVGRTGRARFEDTLHEHRPVPLVSLVAHGYQGGGKVALENADRTSEPVPASSIAAALRAAATRVALLWSCHGARHHAELGSLAELLLLPSGGDLAAVLAAHGAVRADWTPRAVRRIFDSLTTSAGNDLEQAVAHARQTLTEEDLQWAALAYYARPADGRSVTYEDAARAALEALSIPAAVEGAAPYMGTKGLPLSTPRTDRVEGIPRRPRHWVDRPGEVREIIARVATGRLVTVRGMPGIGKTEVTREAAEQIVRDPAFSFDAALWVALDELGSVDDLRERIAAWAGLHEPDVPDWRLVKAIGERRALWVLDNAEDLIRTDGAGLRDLLGGLVEKCPGVRLMVTSQRPVGALRGEPEAAYLVRRIEDADTCLQLFAAASGSPLGERAQSEEVRTLVELLDGHPRSLVLVAGQIRDGGANLPAILARLRERGDEAILAAELLESGTDWSDDDRLRAERLVASLHLAYRPLLENAPGAAELFAWLGTLPAGLPVALAGAIFGDDTPERIATLSRFSLVELRGVDERLDLPTPVRWYAERRLDKDIPLERQGELLARTLDAIGSFMAAAYKRIGKPGAGVVVEMSRREALNLEVMLRRLEQRASAVPDLARIVARAFWRWSRVREAGGNHSQQVPLIERAVALVASLEGDGEDPANLVFALGNLYRRTDRLADAEDAYTTALAAFAAIDERLGEANTISSLGMLAVAQGRPAEGFERFRSARADLLAINGHLSAAAQLGYMARAARSLFSADRAIVLGGMAVQELRALDDRFSVMLAGRDLVGAAIQAENEQVAEYALMLTWHHAREIEPTLAAELVPMVTSMLPPEKVAAGLDPDEVDELEQLLDAAIAEVAKRLEDAGEDPWGPLPPPPPPPPSLLVKRLEDAGEDPWGPLPSSPSLEKP